MLAVEVFLDEKNHVVVKMADDRKTNVYHIPPDKAREVAGAIHRAAVQGIVNLTARNGSFMGRMNG